MNKDRLGAFMDAVIAIVMTILVLELDKPAAPTLQAFWDLRINFAEYALSFLWLAAMWTSLHNAWHVADKISGRTMWLSLGLLFIDIGIKIAGTILGVLIWPPFASIGVLIAAVFIAIMRRGNPEVERD